MPNTSGSWPAGDDKQAERQRTHVLRQPLATNRCRGAAASVHPPPHPEHSDTVPGCHTCCHVGARLCQCVHKRRGLGAAAPLALRNIPRRHLARPQPRSVVGAQETHKHWRAARGAAAGAAAAEALVCAGGVLGLLLQHITCCGLHDDSWPPGKPGHLAPHQLPHQPVSNSSSVAAAAQRRADGCSGARRRRTSQSAS
jgi:hypothetical protein